MTIDKFIFRVAGVMILGSVVLSIYHHQNWLWLTGFVGANMFQASFSGFCPLASILKKLGMTPGKAF